MANTDPRKTNDSKIAQMRISRGMTQKQLAQRIACKQAQLSRWELGWNSPRIGALVQLAKALECKIEDLI